MDYVEASDILEEMNNNLKFIPQYATEWTATVKRIAKLQLYIQEYDAWADAEAQKYQYQREIEMGV
jgi:hypothetical protein